MRVWYKFAVYVVGTFYVMLVGHRLFVGLSTGTILATSRRHADYVNYSREPVHFVITCFFSMLFMLVGLVVMAGTWASEDTGSERTTGSDNGDTGRE
jgi:hypothetical protein